jgi:hypothetical protein
LQNREDLLKLLSRDLAIAVSVSFGHDCLGEFSSRCAGRSESRYNISCKISHLGLHPYRGSNLCATFGMVGGRAGRRRLHEISNSATYRYLSIAVQVRKVQNQTMNETVITIRRARGVDAGDIAAVHDAAWRDAYRGLIPGREL